MEFVRNPQTGSSDTGYENSIAGANCVEAVGEGGVALFFDLLR